MVPLKDAVLFAVVPDVVGDHEATLGRWMDYASVVRPYFPPAFVLQDGATMDTIPWSEMDALFIGGSTEFKLSEFAHEAIAYAKSRGIWTHVGRVNSFNRLRRFAEADSADGTTLAIAPDTNLPKVLRWVEWIDRHPVLDLARSAKEGG